MAKLGNMMLFGESGTAYEFGEYSADTDWANDIACVYYVSLRTQRGSASTTHEPIYVGETEDLRVRSADHHKHACFKKHQYNCVSVHEEPNAATRLEITEDLVTVLNPPCND